MMTDEALAALSKSSPISTASYLASLLVVRNWSRTTHSMMSPSRDCRITLIPLACMLDDLSVQTFHGAAPQPSTLFVINSATKLANAWAKGFVHLEYYGVRFEVWPKLMGCCD